MQQDYDRKASVEETLVQNRIGKIKERLSAPIANRFDLLALLEIEVETLQAEISQPRVPNEITLV